jgi:hypothetical protein
MLLIAINNREKKIVLLLTKQQRLLKGELEEAEER